MRTLPYTCTIDRGQWSTGKSRRVKREGENMLRHPVDGKCCVMGHYAKQVLGMADTQITDRYTLTSLIRKYGALYPEAQHLYPEREDAIVGINDNRALTQRERETDLIALFDRYLDTTLTFTGRFRA